MNRQLDFNQLAAVAASLQELSKDREAPVHLEGDIIIDHGDGTIDFLDMDPGESARRVVEKVLQHPYVQDLLNQADQMWEALKWITMNAEAIPIPPPELELIIDCAIDASEWNESNPTD